MGETCIYMLAFEDDAEAHDNECSLFYPNVMMTTYLQVYISAWWVSTWMSIVITTCVHVPTHI
jgi:hypothetical protein